MPENCIKRGYLAFFFWALMQEQVFGKPLFYTHFVL